jgi:Na+/proline symporter
MASMHWIDYVIFVAFLASSLGIGVYHSVTGGRQKTTQEFIMANRKLHVIPTVLSLLASYQSAIMILGNTAEMYNWGIQAWVVGLVMTVISIIIAERLFVPWLYPLKLVSVYEVQF